MYLNTYIATPKQHPHCAKHKLEDTPSMEGSPKKQAAQSTSAIGDDDSRRFTRSRTRKTEKAGSKAVVSIRERMIVKEENDANTLPLAMEPASTSATPE